MKRSYVLFASLFAFLLAATTVFAVDVCTIGFETAPTAMPAERGRLGGVVVGNYFYVMGGWNNSGLINDDLYRYDPFTDTWDDTLAAMPNVLANHCVVAVDGMIHAIGGFDEGANYSNKHYIYDIASDIWTTGASYPLAVSGTVCDEIDGIIYAAGGAISTGYTANAYSYDPDTDTWTAIASLPVAKGYGRGLAYQGLFYAIGGWSDNSLHAYDPGTDSWSTLDTFSTGIHDGNVIGPLQEDLQDYFFVYGYGPDATWTSNGTVMGYSTSGDSWYTASLFGSLPTAVQAAASDNFYNAYFLIAGGYTDSVMNKSDALQIFRYCSPYLRSVDPGEVLNYEAEGSVLNLVGLHFDDQAESDLFLEDGTKARVDFATYTITDANNATATLPAGLAAGAYELVVKNSAWTGMAEYLSFASLPGALVVLAPAPEVTGIDPATGEIDDAVSVEITGDHFFGAPTVVLSGPAKADITATSVVVGDVNTITCDFDLSGAEAGDYDVVVTTDNGDGTLAGGFNIPAAVDDDITDDDVTDDDTGDDDDDDDDDDDTDDDDDDDAADDDDDDEVDDDDDDNDDDGCCGC